MADDIQSMTDAQLLNAIAAQRGKPDWTLETPGLDQQEKDRRVLDFYRTQEAAGVGVREAIKRGEQYFPGLNHQAMAQGYERLGQERKLEEARKEDWGVTRRAAEWFGAGQNLPFGSVLRAGKAVGYEAAKKRYDAGTPEEGDYQKIAAFERLARVRQEMNQSAGTGLLYHGGELLPMLGEFAAGAPVARGLTAAVGLAPRAVAAGATAAPLLSRAGALAAGRTAAGLGVETALMTAAAPSTYLDRAVEENRQAGRPVWDVRGLSRGYGLGLAQMAVLRGAGALGGKVLPEGLVDEPGRLVATLAVSAGGGVIGSAAADVLTSSVGLDTGYGTVGQLLGIGQPSAPKDALYHATLQALTFATFAGAHYKSAPPPREGEPRFVGPPRPPPQEGEPGFVGPPQEVARVLREQAAQGASRDQAAASVGQATGDKPPPPEAPPEAPPEVPPEGPPQPPPAAPKAPFTGATPKPPPEAPPAAETPRQRVERLESEWRALGREMDTARTDAGMGLRDRTGELGRRKEALLRDLEQAHAALPREAAPRIINPVAPNEALRGLRTGAVEVPVEQPRPAEAPPQAPRAKVSAEDWLEVNRLTEAGKLEEAGDLLLSKMAPEVREGAVLGDAHRGAIEAADLSGREEAALRGLLSGLSARQVADQINARSRGTGKKEIGAEAVRKAGASAARRMSELEPDLFGRGSKTVAEVLEFLSANSPLGGGKGRVGYVDPEMLSRRQAGPAGEGQERALPIDRPARPVEEMTPDEIVRELEANAQEMRDVIADLARAPEARRTTPVPGEAPEAVPAEAAPGAAAGAARGTEGPGQGAVGVEAPAAAGRGAQAGGELAQAQRGLDDARDAIYRGEGQEGAEGVSPAPRGAREAGQGGGPPGAGEAPPGEAARGKAGVGRWPAAAGGVPEPPPPGGPGGGAGERPVGEPPGGRRGSISGGQPSAERDAAVDALADQFLKDQIGQPPGPPPQVPPGAPGEPPPPPDWAARRKAEVKDYLHRVWDHVRFGFAELSGRMFPRLHEAARKAGEAFVTFVTHKGWAREMTPEMIDKVGGPEMTPEQDRLWGAAFVEMRLRRVREAAVASYRRALQEAADLKAKVAATPEEGQATGEALAVRNAARKAEARAAELEQAARDVGTLVGKEGSPLASEADFQKAQADPQFQAMLGRWKGEMAPFMDKWYRAGAGLAPDDPIYSPTQMLEEGLPLNLLPKRRGGADVTPTTVFTGAAEAAGGQAPAGGKTFTGAGRGNLEGQKLRRSLFERQATGAAEGYETSLGALIEHSVAESLKVGTKAEAFRAARTAGVGEWGAPRQQITLPDGSKTREVPGVRPPSGTQEAEAGQTSFYVREDLYPEFRKGLATDEPVKFPLLSGVNAFLSKIALSSTVEAAYHSKNLLTMLMKPYMVRNFFGSAHDVIQGDPRVQAELADLARIGAGAREAPEGSAANPLVWMSRFLHTLDRTMRVAAGRAFEQMKEAGLPIDTEANKRDFINQLGQYEVRAQHRAVALLRDTGMGPFATAGTNFWAQGLRGLTLSPGVKATSYEAAARLRAQVLGKLVAVVGGTALANYILWGDPYGDDRTPLGALKLHQSADLPRTASLDFLSLTGATRGLRSVGAMAYLEAARSIPGPPPKETTLDKATSDILHGLIHPAMGPPVAFAWTAATGRDTLGRQVAAKPEEKGGSHAGHNLAAAVKHLNPAVAAVTGAAHPGAQVPAEEKAAQLLGPFGPKFRYQAGYKRPQSP